jgi:GTP-binding protein Era
VDTGNLEEHKKGQLVFIDTPGRHLSDKKYNKTLLKASNGALRDADLALYVLDAAREPAEEEAETCAALRKLGTDWVGQKTAVALNKADLPRADMKRLRLFLAEQLPELHEQRIFEISALHGRETDALLDALFELAPEGEACYPADCYTDQDVAFRVSEIIRGAAIVRLHDELPHAVFVDVEELKLENAGTAKGGGGGGTPAAARNAKLTIHAAICVERESQKGMVVGKGGKMLGAIREAAQKDLSGIFDWKVRLHLRVKTVKDWRRKAGV